MEITSEIYYLRSGRRKRHTYSIEDLENIKILLINKINQIVQDTSFVPTSNTRTCSYCEHAKTGACGTGVFRNKKASGA
jgi:CRISPR/Cas system-associated exonuclease Cas4 (RecB family)